MAVDPERALKLMEVAGGLFRCGRMVTHRRPDQSVTSTSFMTLGLVFREPRRLGDLAGLLMVQPSVASRAVDALEKAGLAVRTHDPDDLRAVRIKITPRGREKVERRRQELIEQVSAAFQDWPAEDVDRAIDVLTRLGDLMTDWGTQLESRERGHGLLDHRESAIASGEPLPDRQPSAALR